ncbi:MAG: HxsD-like protein [Myxococcota bacterium]
MTAEPLVLRFHRSLYATDAVRAAVARFSSLVGGTSVEEVEADVMVTLTDVPDRLRGRIADEVGNHALFETIVARRQGS